MAEYIEREAAIAWFMPYVHAGESIEADVIISDLKGMKAADVSPVRHGRWIERKSFHAEGGIVSKCSACQKDVQYLGNPLNFCPNCGARMDLEVDT